MSGKASRERRKEAVNNARKAVYAANGVTAIIVNPYTDERCYRIFNKYVLQWLNIYWKHETDIW